MHPACARDDGVRTGAGNTPFALGVHGRECERQHVSKRVMIYHVPLSALIIRTVCADAAFMALTQSRTTSGGGCCRFLLSTALVYL